MRAAGAVAIFCAILFLSGGTALAQPGNGFYQSWVAESERRLAEEGRYLETRILAASRALEAAAAQLVQTHGETGALSADDPHAAFRLIEDALGADPEVLGLPLGVQILREGELLGWAGWPVPLDRSRAGASAPAPRLSLRAFGVHQFLTSIGKLPGDGSLQWVLDLPLARRDPAPADRGGLPVLLAVGRGLSLRLLPPVPSSVREQEGEALVLEPVGETTGSVQDGLERSWRLASGGRDILELHLRGPGETEYGRGIKARRRLWRGLGAFILFAALGLWLRQRLRRGRPGGLPLAWRAPLIVLLVVVLRGLLVHAGIPAVLFPGSSFWSARDFALDGLGGFFASPGEFLFSALAAFLVLVLVLRPYLRPEEEDDGEEAEAWQGESKGSRSTAGPRRLPILLLAFASPWLGVLAAGAFARLVHRNSAAPLLFEERLLAPEVLGLSMALFFALSFLLVLFLSPAQLAWRRLALNRGPRLAIAGAMLVLTGLLAGPAAALALALLYPVAWGFRRAAAPLTGLVYHLFFVVIAVTLLSHDAVEGERRAYLRTHLSDLAVRAEDAVGLWRTALLEEALLDMGRDEGLRREMGRPEGLEPLTALALWRSSGLQELGEKGGLEIFDGRGLRRGRCQWGIDLPLRSLSTLSRQDRPDLWITVERKELPRAGDRISLLVGELVMAGPEGRLGTLALTLVDRRESPGRVLANSAWSPETPLAGLPAPSGVDRLFLARMTGERITSSSDPSLLADPGLRPPDAPERWERRSLDGEPYRLALLGDGSFLAGYRETPLLDQLLSGALRLFLHLLVLVALLLIDLLFSRFRLVRRYLPPLIGPGGLGFQQKLLGAFLLVALLPTVLTGIIAGRQLRRQYEEASQKASLERVLAAQRSLENRVRQDAQDLAASEYVQSFVAPDFPPVPRDIGSLENNWVMIFDAADSLILDESLRNLSPAEGREFLAGLPTDRVVYEREGNRLYAGLLLPIEVQHRRERLTGSAYYRMLLGEGLLDDLADVVGGDLSLYREGSLLHSNQPFLYGLGYQPPVLDPDGVEELLRGGAPYRQGVGRAGKQDFGYASLPLPGPDGRPVAVLSSLDFSGLAARQAALEQGGSVVFSMIAFLIVLALGLGGFLAGRVFLPIRHLQLGTRRLAAGDLSHRLAPLGRDEIGELVRSFNSMAGGLQETRRALEERQRFLEGVLENVASGVLTIDDGGRVRSANSAARGLLAMAAGELEGRSLAELSGASATSGLDPGPLFRLLAEAGPETRARELRLEHPAGARSFRVASTGLGEGRVVVFEDVTELIRSQKLSAWGEMARQVAHEIKNPLTPIKLSAQHLGRAWRDRKEDFGEILEDGLGSITEQVEILRNIAQEFSQFGRRPELSLEAVDLASLLAEILAPYRGETLQVSWEGPESLPVSADREALRKVLLNLVENAREAMEGSGRLEVVLGADAGTGRAELSLRDHGPGVPEEARDRLFEPYFSTKTSGTGLGLAISAQLVEEMGGQLSLENHPGGGAVARLFLASC